MFNIYDPAGSCSALHKRIAEEFLQLQDFDRFQIDARGPIVSTDLAAPKDFHSIRKGSFYQNSLPSP